MHNSRSTLTPFDSGIERVARDMMRTVREATLAQRILVEENPLISLDAEEDFTMEVVPPPIMGDYCKRTDEGHVSRGFVSENPSNFDIKNYVLSGLRDNPFNENAIRDSWKHLARFYETTSM
ncbi:unnamed protein product [Lathyrus oleraceus]